MIRTSLILLTILLISLLGTPLQGEEADDKTLVTKDGMTYTGVMVTGHTDSHLSILHDAGGAKVHFEKLSKDLQKKYNYQPFKVWQTDYNAVKRLSTVHNRPVLISFIGSDWDADSKTLIKDVLTSREFLRYAEKNLVLLEVDSPKTTPMPKKQREQNEKLAKEFGVDTFPKILVLTPEGEEVGELGLYKGGREEFMTALQGVLLSTQPQPASDEEVATESAGAEETSSSSSKKL